MSSRNEATQRSVVYELEAEGAIFRLHSDPFFSLFVWELWFDEEAAQMFNPILEFFCDPGSFGFFYTMYKIASTLSLDRTA